MNALNSSLFDVQASPTAFWFLLAAKLTSLLTIAWLLHFVLGGANPRWRVLLWRGAAVGAVVVTTLAVCPPLWSWAVLPGGSGATSDAAESHVVTLVASPERDRSENARSAIRPVAPARIGRPGAAESLPGPSVSIPETAPGAEPAETSAIASAPSQALATERRSSSENKLAITSSPWTLAGWTAAIWFAGMLVCVSYRAAGLWHLLHVVRSSKPIANWIGSEAAVVAERLAIRRRFTVRRTGSLPIPCLVGLFRPVVLLPEQQCEEAYSEELPAVLAHELAHLKGGDLVWSRLLHGLSILLWFHPLTWRMPRAHGDACDAVCDAVAADYVGDAGVYGRTLARLALRLASAGAPVGLAMARKSSVRRRVEAVERFVFRAGLPRWPARTVVALAAAAVLLLGGLALTKTSAAPAEEALKAVADAASDRPEQAKVSEKAGDVEAEPAFSVLTIRCLADATEEPMKGVELRFEGRIGGEEFEQSLRTGEDGTAEMKWPAGATIETLHMKATSPGHTPIQCGWESQTQVTELPDHLELRFEEGIRIGGVVQDKEGRTIPGATVQLGMRTYSPRQLNDLYIEEEVVTDENGRWEWDCAPKRAANLYMWAIVPGYFNDTSRSPTADMENVIVLQKGLQVVGRVLDSQGNPVEGAVAQLDQEQQKATTGADGRFVIENCRPEPATVVVRAEGLAIQVRELTVGQQDAPLEFRLEPGQLFRGRVVDVEGKPIEGASIRPTSWRGNRVFGEPIETDKEGRFQWHGAPADAVEYSISKPGYMARRDTPFMVSEEEHVITLHSQLIITGLVTDAETGEPLPEFCLQYARLYEHRPIRWRGNLLCKNGRYTYRFGYLAKGWQLQATAPGYLPEASRVFESTEGQQTYDFKLKRSEGPAGIVLLPDGEPAAGAQVALARPEKGVYLRNGRLRTASPEAFLVETDGEGRFSFPAFQEEEFLIVAAGEAGYVEATNEEFAASNRLHLKPWGRLDGTFMMGDRPGVGCHFVFNPSLENTRYQFVSGYGGAATTDDQGKFEFEHVVPGPGTLSLTMSKHFGTSTTLYYSRQTRVEIKAGETSRVTIGGTGRPVKGRFVLDWKPETPVDWQTNDPVKIETWDIENNRETSDRVRFVGFVDESGRFEIPDVAAGDYRLRVPVNLPPDPQEKSTGDEIGRAELVFSVPEMSGGRSNEPLDLGTIEAKLFDVLDVGEVAAEFVVQGLKGGLVRLAEHRGKLILLNFWATQNERSLDEMAILKTIHEEFRTNPRFAMVSVACDSSSSRPRDYVENLGLDWEQAYVNGLWSELAKSYAVRSLPTSFLIAPNGHVLARNLPGDELKRTVADALADDVLFETDPDARPRRFPVTRFDLAEKQPAPREQPAVVVLSERSYENTEAGKLSQGNLRALTATGEELWKNAGIEASNTYGSYHSLAVDRRRNRIYAHGDVTSSVHAFTLDGQKIWQLDNLRAGALVVDEKTGDLWCCTHTGEIVVFDGQGNEKTSFLLVPIDMAYNPKSDSFWLVGSEVLVLNREGEVRFREEVAGECNTVAVNSKDGSVWFVEVEASDLRKTQRRLHVLNVDGKPRRTIDLGERGVCTIVCLPEVDEVWVGLYPQGIQRYSTDGEFIEELAVEGRTIAASPTTGEIWRNTTEAIVHTDATGRILSRVPHDKPFPYWAWIVVF